MFCRLCGKKVNGSEELCDDCKNLAQLVSKNASIAHAKPNKQAPPSKTKEDDGSFWVGFFCSLFLGLIGLIIALSYRRRGTKLGAIAGFKFYVALTLFELFVFTIFYVAYFYPVRL
ncbi:MAG: hypothetical protein E7381_04105 [Clostridiales bacterium]|nr:hypothetical protein [Clostridiales bacterium]